MVELVVLGISLQEEVSPVLLLHPVGTRRVLSIAIGPMEAFAISTALHGEEAAARSNRASASFPRNAQQPPSPLFPRPMTHDFLLNIINSLGCRLVCIDILRVVDGAYIAEADVQADNRQVRVDCRPSDGIALALRCGARIRAAEIVLEHSEDIDQVMAALPDHARTIATARLASLAMPDMAGPGIATVEAARADAVRADAVSADPARTDAQRREQNMPAAVKQALAVKINAGEHGELVSVARKMIEDEARRAEESHEVEAYLQNADARAPKRIKVDVSSPDPRQQNIQRAPVVKINGVPVPQIKVAMVRQTVVPEPALKGGIHSPAGDLTDKTLTALGLSRREAEAVLGAPDNDRWAMLLRLLAPETKDPM